MTEENQNLAAGQTEKKSKKKIIIIVVVAIVVIGIIGAAMGGGSNNSGSSSTGNSASSSSSSSSSGTDSQKSDQSKEKYTVTDEAGDTSNPYMYSITGKLTNNTDKKLSYLQITYILKDAEGAQVGTAYATTNDLAAGGVWKFSAASTVAPDKVATFERSEITGY